ncbi:MAG: hypothetical protein MZV63_24360 [Marinilabiliales bacterium]|nr:hypothetical protein [Marinilabiliales bacterium]
MEVDLQDYSVIYLSGFNRHYRRQLFSIIFRKSASQPILKIPLSVLQGAGISMAC